MRYSPSFIPSRRIAASSVIAAMLLTASAVAAQSSTGPVRVGVAAGFSSATVSGEDSEGAGQRNGFAGGVYLVKPLSGMVAFRPELLFAQKGASTKFDEGGVTGSGTIKLSYIDVPLLVQLEATKESGVRPHVYAGPSIGFKIGCSLEAKASGVSESSSCDEAESNVKSIDVGAVVGGGLGFSLGTLAATVGVRAQQGLTNLSSDAKIKNRVFGAYVSFERSMR